MTIAAMEPETLAARTDAMLDAIGASRSLNVSPWRREFHDVPRHRFIPDAAWAHPEDGTPPYAIDAARDPAGWWTAVLSDLGIVTQWDDGETLDGGHRQPTSSCSAPSVVLAFLLLLNPQPGDRILEAGTGTGWTSALLSRRVGERRVTSIEVDPRVAAQARANLAAGGITPHLLVGDAGAGWAEGGPYDGVHVTFGVDQIPLAWIDQTRPGGAIVLPWSPGSPAGFGLRLDVIGDGTAVGRFSGRATYMPMRSQRPGRLWNPHHQDEADHAATRISPQTIRQAGPGAELAILAEVPGVAWRYIDDADGAVSMLISEPGRPGGSWAACDHEPNAAEYAVTQYGDRRLWDEVVSAYHRWLSRGRPGMDRYGLTVTPDGQQIWLDSPPT